MKPLGKRVLFQLFFTYLPLAVLVYILILFILIRRTAARDDAQAADIIVVLGAAQYNGRPSPVFRARLDHTAALFRRNYASRILTTGGYGFDRRYSEAGVGKSYLVKQNIPGDCILTEASGSTTVDSLEKSIELLKLQKFTRVIAVSDGFHLFRIKRILRDHKITAFGSPAQNSLIESSFRSRVWASLREVFVYTAYLAQHKLHLPIVDGPLSQE
ncbi:MAG: YdcF family protein [Acidobacteria bacterium]|nr:YdcF family protein [Acidobacteriota bacterium]MCI0626070.1 YdcF family protein [Acidobacteriota bacterium]MCI0717404.1 YdcF family protein [Acidobacteriota bacterium]